MPTAKLVQVCAYANWLDESFEIWRLYPANRSHKGILKEMRSLFLWIFSQVAINKALEDLECSSFTIGGVDDEVDVDLLRAGDITKRVYYGWYHGRCLDKERLQYFTPEKIIKHGVVELGEKNEAKVYELTKSIKTEKHPESPKLELRRMLGDDPKRIEIDEMRSKLGLPSDFLFDWKVEYQMKKKPKRGHKTMEKKLRSSAT